MKHHVVVGRSSIGRGIANVRLPNSVPGAALHVAAHPAALGGVDVAPVNGSDILELMTVDLSADSVGPLDDAPAVDEFPDDVELLLSIGRDRV